MNLLPKLPLLLLLLSNCYPAFRCSVAGFAPLRTIDVAAARTRTMVRGDGVVVTQPRRHWFRYPPPSEIPSSGLAASKFGWIGERWDWTTAVADTGDRDGRTATRQKINGAAVIEITKTTPQQEFERESVEFNSSSFNETDHRSSIATSDSSALEENETESDPNTTDVVTDDSNNTDTATQRTGFGSYFSFLPQPQSISVQDLAIFRSGHISNSNDDSSKGKNKIGNNNDVSASDSGKNLATDLLNKQANETITVESDPNTTAVVTDDSNDTDTATQRSGFGSYFSFLPKPQSKTVHISKSNDDNSKGNNKIANNKIANNNDASASDSGKDLATDLLKKQANETVTVADLEVLLAQLRQAPRSSGRKPDRTKAGSVSDNSRAAPSGSIASSTTGSSAASSSSSNVAFPQPSEVSPREIRRGTGIVCGFFGMILGITIFPNLWLMGILFGVFYGIEITKDVAVGEDQEPIPKSAAATLLIACGTRLASACRRVLDGGKALWFLYKTGQLSYEYYKTYEALDQKFALQNKVDAWNSVFVQGKRKFDAWEQENEVSRKALAGLRTFWLLEDESRVRASGRSRYRLVQLFYVLRRIVAARARVVFRWLRSREGVELRSFWKGLSLELRSEGSLALRIGAIGAAIAAVNIFGALFSLSAVFANLLAVGVAVVWPSWTTDLWSRADEIGRELRSRGSSGGEKKNPAVETPWEWMLWRYEDYSRDRVARSRRKNRRTRRNRSSSSSSSSNPFSVFGTDRRKNRPGSVGTWPYFNRNR